MSRSSRDLSGIFIILINMIKRLIFPGNNPQGGGGESPTQRERAEGGEREEIKVNAKRGEREGDRERE